MKNTVDNLVKFASASLNNEILSRAFLDYWYHSNHVEGRYSTEFSLDEKEAKVNKAIKEEIIKRANLGIVATAPVEEWFFYPNVAPAAFSVVGSLIDMILPDSIIDTIGIYSDVKVIGWGDSASFDIKPRDLFAVSRATLGKRVAEVKKQWSGQVTIVPEIRAISVGVSLYRVLAGKESLADFTAKAIRSIETQMTVDVYNAMATAMAALPSTATTGLQISGYSQANLVRLSEQVTAWNQGAKAMLFGTAVGLLNVLPDDLNYRYDLESKYVAVGHIPTISGIDVMRLPQVADIATPFGRVLSDTNLWVLSPSSQKIIKVVLEGNTLSNTTQPFENADLSQTTTLWKSYGIGVATNAVAGLITL
jgi:hypothetical protein